MQRYRKVEKGSPGGRHMFSVLFRLGFAFSLFLAACTSPSTPIPTQTPTAPKTPDSSTIPVVTRTSHLSEGTTLMIEVDGLMNKFVDRMPLAGVALGIHFKDGFYERGYGFADIAEETPVTAQTVFRIASLTKSFTAAAILRLSEEQKLSLDDPIARFLPGAPGAAKNIRVRHLLNHTSGLPELEFDRAQAALPDPFTIDQVIDHYFKRVRKLDFQPGETWRYSNTGYFLLGAIIEKVSGMPYDEYFKVNFFEPLDLRSSGACGSYRDVLAVGYHSVQKQLEAARPSNLKLGTAAGSLCGTPGDLLKWLDALTHEKVVRAQTWRRMITPATLPNGQKLEYGFGFVIEQGNQGMRILHEGITPGFSSIFVYYPEHDLSIVLLTNTDGFDPSLRSMAALLAGKLTSQR